MMALLIVNQVIFFHRCCFRCKTCRYTLWDETAMNAHLRKCPWLSKTGQKKAESETVVRNVYRCKICDFAVTHKRGAIDGHVKKRHGINLISYSEQYECGE